MQVSSIVGGGEGGGRGGGEGGGGGRGGGGEGGGGGRGGVRVSQIEIGGTFCGFKGFGLSEFYT